MKKEIPKHKLVERRGIYYEVDSIVPFTGSTVEYHIFKKNELKKRVQSSQLNYRSKAVIIFSADLGQLAGINS